VYVCRTVVLLPALSTESTTNAWVPIANRLVSSVLPLGWVPTQVASSLHE
jgi:hypothetical protein